VRDWPPIDDPELLAWLAIDDDAWKRWIREEVWARGPRPFTAADAKRALGYPWKRPAGSYVVREKQVALLEEMDEGARVALVEEFATDRYPLVAFGANGAPSRLIERFSDFQDPADRGALVLTGDLHEVDVGANATPSIMGTVPGALFASPGTSVRASVLWLTAPQLAKLTKAELGYRLGRLERAHFAMDEALVEVEDLFAYVSRGGALQIEGEPIALAAVPATGRAARAMTQAELLELFAEMAFGRSMPAPEVIRMCHEDMVGLADRVTPITWPTALRLPSDHWTPYPAAGRE
jgi:hypothetical protein